jgi:hypothetical protein
MFHGVRQGLPLGNLSVDGYNARGLGFVMRYPVKLLSKYSVGVGVHCLSPLNQ